MNKLHSEVENQRAGWRQRRHTDEEEELRNKGSSWAGDSCKLIADVTL